MGEYWKPVNLTRREYIHPHDFGEGLKNGEWNHPGSGVMQLIKARWPSTDVVGAVSDYDRYMWRSHDGTWRIVDHPDRARSPRYEDLDDEESGFVRVRSADQPLADVVVEPARVVTFCPKAYRPKGKIEAVRWVDTPECRETMARWFETYDDQFVTMGPIALVPTDDGNETPVKVGEWIVRIGDEWCAMTDDTFTLCYDEVVA